ncbi:MAG: hypothetical protein ACPKPY_10790 [Nitrososphaeraceae archaeon]
MEKLHCGICDIEVEFDEIEDHIKKNSHTISKKKLIHKKEEILRNSERDNMVGSVYSKWKNQQKEQ